MAPLIVALRKEDWARVVVVATGQHREMLDQVFGYFDLRPDIDLQVMTPNQSLAELTARLLVGLDDVLKDLRPDAVLAQGDTTTVMSASLAAFYRRIPFGHVEAGLRTGDINNPFPEEANRVIVGCLASWHFAPTETARTHLIEGGRDPGSIVVTGNTVIDALKSTLERKPALAIDLDPDRRMVLVTVHRRESFGAPFANICLALRDLSQAYPDVTFLYPVHPNPNIHGPAHRMLGDRENVILCPPLEYPSFVAALSRCHIVISDSGGVQEEAPALGKPVLVLREDTERPEAVDEGVVKLVGANRDRIVSEARRLLDDDEAWRRMAKNVSPYGDGKASNRIVEFLRSRFR